MNSNIKNLYSIAKKESRIILGLMSGTSLDGLDLALCRIKGNGKTTELSVLKYDTLPYSSIFKDEIKSIFAKENVDFKMVCVMHAKIATTHATIINKALKKWNISPKEIDLIASHGQTVYHAPNRADKSNHSNSTLQIGDGDHIAVLTEIITISDFRQKHIAAGGEGAPLAIYGDSLLFANTQQNRILLNIGGISNLTFLPICTDTDQIISTDVGPGNTLMDQYMSQYFDLPYDKNGAEAARGKVCTPLLKSLLKHPFFEQAYPKTTGPETFNMKYLLDAKKKSNSETLNHQDTLATLINLTAYGIVKAIKPIVKKYENTYVYISGGGLHNPILMKKLKEELPDLSIQSTSVLGIPPDAKEAILFALLANETIAGEPILFPKKAGAPAICMGKISFPK